jgi:hypothetical protein
MMELTWQEVNVLCRMLRWRAGSGEWPQARDIKPWGRGARPAVNRLVTRGVVSVLVETRGRKVSKRMVVRLGPGGDGGLGSRNPQTESRGTG